MSAIFRVRKLESLAYRACAQHCFYRASYAKRGLGSRNYVCPSVRQSHACFVANPKNLPAIFLYHMKGQSFLSYVIFRTVVQQLTRFQLS